MNKNTQIFLVILINFITYTCNQCLVTTELNSCVITYSTCIANATKPLVSCLQTLCADDSTPCNNHITFSLNQSSCLSTCCNSSHQYFNIDQLNRCEKYDMQKLVNAVIIIVFIVVGVIAVLAIVISVCLCGKVFKVPCNNAINKICKKLQCPCCIRNGNAQSKQSQMSQSSQNIHKQSLSELSHKQWHQQSPQIIKNIIKSKDIICAICLYQHINTLSQCEHYYHIQCIVNWYAKNRSCPICRCKDEKIRNIKLYCCQCYNKYIYVDLKTITKNINKMNRQNNDNNQNLMKFIGLRCEECR